MTELLIEAIQPFIWSWNIVKGEIWVTSYLNVKRRGTVGVGEW